MSFYYLISRLGSPVITALFYVYSLFTNTQRARLVVQNEGGEVLLIQAWPDTSIWNLPGGGMKRSERPEDAAARELHEETGLQVNHRSMRQRLTFRTRGHDELVFTVTVEKNSLPPTPPNRWEVRSMKWFSLDSLPDVSPSAHHILTEVAVGR